MTTQKYLQIEENVVTNIVVWDGNTQTWSPPTDATMLVQATTGAMLWELDISTSPASYVLVEQMGAGDIGFTWNGSVLTTNQSEPQPPTPASDQPTSNGTTTI